MMGQLNIETLFAFIVRDDDGTEGVLAEYLPGGMPLVFVGADLERVESLKPRAQELATRFGKAVHVVHFSSRRDVETLEPNRLRPPTGERIGGEDSSLSVL